MMLFNLIQKVLLFSLYLVRFSITNLMKIIKFDEKRHLCSSRTFDTFIENKKFSPNIDALVNSYNNLLKYSKTVLKWMSFTVKYFIIIDIKRFKYIPSFVYIYRFATLLCIFVVHEKFSMKTILIKLQSYKISFISSIYIPRIIIIVNWKPLNN